MEIKIGITHVPRELNLDADLTAEQVEQALATALTDGGVLSLTDTKGRRVLVPGERIAYVDLGKENSRPVGFGL